MRLYARMIDGRRAQIISSMVDAEGRDVPSLASRFPLDVVAQLVEYDPRARPAPPPPTLQERIATLLFAVDQHLNAAAAARGYESIARAALRAAYEGPWQAEGVAFAQWMDAVYARCYQLLDQFNAGEIAEPTAEELIPLLPQLELP